jgi:hypothetical protein
VRLHSLLLVLLLLLLTALQWACIRLLLALLGPGGCSSSCGRCAGLICAGER